MVLDIHFRDKDAKVQGELKNCPDALSYSTSKLRRSEPGSASLWVAFCGSGAPRQHKGGYSAASLASTH